MFVTIENEKLLVKTSTHGAALASFIDKATGVDIVLGFDSDEAYGTHAGNPYFGATVGRCANRIGGAEFSLNGNTYKLKANNGPNCLHSGGDSEGLTWRNYEIKEQSKDRVVFKTFSKDGEAGFPGDLDFEVAYELDGDSLIYSFKGCCSKDSLFNITNHVYFNLNGEGDILDHNLQILTDKVAINDANGMASPDVLNVEGTSFDFTKRAKIKDRLDLNSDNLAAGGLDHHFVFENLNNKKLTVLDNEKLCLSIYSDLPGVQVYTANGVKDLKGRSDNVYQKFCGIAMEAQFYPNAINYSDYLKPIIRESETITHYIRFELKEF